MNSTVLNITPIHTLLVANRGEIACRIMRTCQKMGISTVAVYSDADSDAPFVQLADQAVAIGGNTPLESYLNPDKIIRAAQLTNANAIHPGYGFLSENAEFAALCAEHKLIFVGPSPQAIESMGLKDRAKAIVKQFGVPIIEGYNGTDQSLETLSKEALKIGFPVLLKAVAGGGGKGMRIVYAENELEKAIITAKSEALNAFKNDTLLIEKYFESSKHIEFQIVGDKYGNIVHCFERECSIQRRYQKIIEESPAPTLSAELRRQMGEAAVNAARSVQYYNAGTVEFIVTPKNEFYFLEVNTRLQVEHPVTEMVTGLDLVELQINIAQGYALPFTQNELKQTGNAIEVRLYAENPAENFSPQIGKLLMFEAGTKSLNTARYDSGVATNSVVQVFYDPMLAKIITHAPNRMQAIGTMQKTLQDFVVLGVNTNLHFLQSILKHPKFKAGDFDTHFLQKHFEYEAPKFSKHTLHKFCIVALLKVFYEKNNTENTLLPNLPPLWRNVPPKKFFTQGFFAENGDSITCEYNYNASHNFLEIIINNEKYNAKIVNKNNTQITCLINEQLQTFTIIFDNNAYYLHNAQMGNIMLKPIARLLENQSNDSEKEQISSATYSTSIPATVVKICVEVGSAVQAGDALLVLNSMKMETTIEAHTTAIVEEIYTTENAFVEANVPLLKMKEE